MEIVKLTIPALVVFLTAFFLIKNFLESQQNMQEKIRITEREKIILPVQLQAYERMMLYLERINPETLIFRLFDPTLSVNEFKHLLVKNIREEFDHNLSQQIYMSHEAWQLIRSAKEDMIRIINVVHSRLTEDSTPTDFISGIFEEFMKSAEPALQKASSFLKKEAHEKFNL
ncbi:MAG: hypothetical protein N2Z72_00650 [Bacteroidales bacterium]|nr:hypothetical protein [Bacteroidales bacterium]